MQTLSRTVKPWYRERWPWFLMAGPAIVVVAGLATAYLAWSTDDGVVADDYYRRGLLINKTLERGERGVALGLGAVVRIAPDGTVRVEVTGETAAAARGTVTLRLIHATRAGHDRIADLARSADGGYQGRIEPPPPGRWLVSVETDTWRLPMAEIAGRPDEVRLGIEAR
jgi:hypothetical protein